MPNEGGFTFANFLAGVFAVFVFVVLIWLLYIVLSDLFRRHDISGWGKALWVIGLVLFPYIGVLAYMVIDPRGWRSAPISKHSRHKMRFGASSASALRMRIKKLDELKKSGSITDQEYARLRGRLVRVVERGPVE